MKRQISITLMILFMIAGLYSTAYAQNQGTIDLPLVFHPTYVYRLTW
jgi:hypothetical protein